MTKMTVVRLPDKTGEDVEKYAQERGLAFATAVRCIVVEHFKGKVLADAPGKNAASTTAAQE